jgi:hypothetical protein
LTLAVRQSILTIRGGGSAIHWNGNGESYWLMGEAMGRAMVELLKEAK